MILQFRGNFDLLINDHSRQKLVDVSNRWFINYYIHWSGKYKLISIMRIFRITTSTLLFGAHQNLTFTDY